MNFNHLKTATLTGAPRTPAGPDGPEGPDSPYKNHIPITKHIKELVIVWSEAASNLWLLILGMKNAQKKK